MGERRICYGYDAGERVPRYEPAPDAPSVAEVVEELRLARKVLEGDCYFLPDGRHRLDVLIARLEGENAKS